MEGGKAATRRWVAKAIDTGDYSELDSIEVDAADSSYAHCIAREWLYKRLRRWGWTCVVSEIKEVESYDEPYHLRYRSIGIDAGNEG